jgi:hypothetical protein
LKGSKKRRRRRRRRKRRADRSSSEEAENACSRQVLLATRSLTVVLNDNNINVLI